MAMLGLFGCPSDDDPGSEGGSESESSGADDTTTDDPTTSGPGTESSSGASADDSTGSDTSADGSSSGSESSTGEPPCTTPEEFVLDIEGFFPVGIDHDADGNFYLGSAALQQVVRVTLDECVEDDILPEIDPIIEDNTLLNVLGVAVDEDRGILWLCNTNRFGVQPDMPQLQVAEIRGYALADGELQVTHPFEPVVVGEASYAGICGDVAVNSNGDIYATDTFAGRIVKVLAANALPEDPLDAGADTWYGFNNAGLDNQLALGIFGITISGSRVFVADIPRAVLRSAAIAGNGSADTAINAYDYAEGTTPPVLPAGAEALEGGSLLIIDANGALLEVTADNAAEELTVTEITTIEDFPSTATVIDTTAWVVESQFDTFPLPGSEDPVPMSFRIAAHALP